MNSYVRIEADYKGNIYLRFRDRCYNVLFDSHDRCETGIMLDPISSVTVQNAIMLLDDHKHLAKYVKRGKIVLSDMTLKGRVTQIIAKMDSEEFNEHAENNLFTSFDSTFKESEFFRIEKLNKDDKGDNDGCEESDDFDDWDLLDTEEIYTTNSDLDYRFSDVVAYNHYEYDNKCADCNDLQISPSIMFSNMLNDQSAHNNTIMIKGDTASKIVISNIQRTDGYCVKRLVFYTNGVIKIQYPNTHTIYSKIVYKNKKLELQQIKKVYETDKE